MLSRRVVVGCWIALLASRLFAACDFRPIVSDPFRITALDVALDGNDLWVATSYGIDLYNRAVDPPALLYRVGLPGPTARIEHAARYAYAASGSTLYVIDRAGLQVVGSVSLGALIHDLSFAAPYLYAATGTGVAQIDLLIPERPVIANRLQTTTGAATSLAHAGSFLYAADGDATVEVYTLLVPSFPQKIGTIDSLARSIAVHTSGTRLFVSDGVQTELFAGSGAQMTRSGSFPTSGTLALHPLAADVVFTAGLDRRLRARDLSSSTVLFDSALPITAGNVNRVQAMAGTSERLYAAAGDLGLLTFDLSGFRAPFPLHAYAIGAVKSVVESGSTVFVSLDFGGLRRFTRDAQGLLIPRESWDEDRLSVVQDATATALLSSAGSSLTKWNIATSPPVAQSTATLAGAIRGAVLIDQVAYAILENRSVWRADLSQQNAAVSPVPISGASPMFIARDGAAIALADLEENGTTTIRFFAGGDLAAAPQILSIEGAATSGIAVSRAGLAAGATFRGVILASFGAGTTTVLPETNTTPTRDLHISGDDLYVLTPAELQVWSLASRELRAAFELPWEGLAVHHSDDEVSVATPDGLVTIVPRSERRQPEQIGEAAENAYYRKLVSGGKYLYLVDGRNVDVYFAPSGLPMLVRRITASGNIVDVAASDERLFVLSSFARVTAYTPAGGVVAEYQFPESENAQPLAIRTLGGAVYVSTSLGCPLACQKKTTVFDPRGESIVPTITLSGALLDGVVDQNKAYTIFDLPKEIRILNLADRFRPVVTSTRASDGDPVSIAYSPSRETVYTLGERLFAYSSASLSPMGTQLDAYIPDPTTRLGYADQVLRMVSSDCAIVAGRAFRPQLHLLASPSVWSLAETPSVPSPVRSIAIRDDFVYLLTDHSLEVWSLNPPTSRPRPVRR
jgi:hypothetical protein